MHVEDGCHTLHSSFHNLVHRYTGLYSLHDDHCHQLRGQSLQFVGTVTSMVLELVGTVTFICWRHWLPLCKTTFKDTWFCYYFRVVPVTWWTQSLTSGTVWRSECWVTPRSMHGRTTLSSVSAPRYVSLPPVIWWRWEWNLYDWSCATGKDDVFWVCSNAIRSSWPSKCIGKLWFYIASCHSAVIDM
jgi:hypothetical protein